MENLIELKNITYSYNNDKITGESALANINLSIKKGEFIGVAGHTGSGKSTVAQILAGLLVPSEGSVFIKGREITDYKTAAKMLRKYVGIVFQHPENQLFEETVYKDIAFGPKSKGLSNEETDACVRKAALYANVDESLFDESPFDLSGGQKRSVAIAGVLATNPTLLILDEPVAGLDPSGRDKLMNMLHKIHREEGTTIILISHSMEDLAENTQRIVVLNHGVKFKDDIPSKVFADGKELLQCGLEPPQITQIILKLNDMGFNIKKDIFTVEDAVEQICKLRGASI